MPQRWHQKATVQQAMVNGGISLVGIALTAVITAWLVKSPTMNSVMVFGDVPQAFGTQTVVTAGNTMFLAPGTMDPTEAGAQLQFKSETVMHELQCISGAVQGLGPGHGIVITGLTGPCGHLDDTGFGCTIRGAKQSNQSCDSADTRAVVRPGECATFRLNVEDRVEQPTYVNCTVRLARITELTQGPGGLPIPTLTGR